MSTGEVRVANVPILRCKVLKRGGTDGRFRHLPVVDDDGGLGGIISIGDVVKSRLGELQSDNEALLEYLHQGRRARAG